MDGDNPSCFVQDEGSPSHQEGSIRDARDGGIAESRVNRPHKNSENATRALEDRWVGEEAGRWDNGGTGQVGGRGGGESEWWRDSGNRG